MYFIENSNLGFLLLLVMSGLDHVAWPLYLSSLSRIRKVDCENLPLQPGGRRLCYWMTFGQFPHGFSNASVINYSCLLLSPVLCQLLSTPIFCFLFRTLQIVVLTMLNVYLLALINFPFSQLQSGLLFSYRQLSLLNAGLSFLTRDTVFKGET